MASAIVVGAGIFGASLAHRLAARGWDVLLLDRDEPGHARAESGGESRLIRCSHGPDAWYARSARRARELWRELEQETGSELLVECGLVWFARREHGWEADSERVLRAEGIPVERLRARQPARRLPEHPHGRPELRPARAAGRRAACARLHPRPGGRRVRPRRAGGGRRGRGSGGRTVIAGGRRLEADLVIWACGAWLARLFPELVELRVTEQGLFFMEAPASGPRRRFPRGWTTTAQPTGSARWTATA